MATLVDDQHAIGVAVERDADIGAHLAHLAAKLREIGRAAILVDVESVGIDADGDDVCAQFPQSAWRYAIRGAIGTIDDDPQSLERYRFWQSELCKLDITILHAVYALGSAEITAFRELFAKIGVEQIFDLAFRFIAQFVAVRPKKLDSVVVERIM